MKKFPTLFKLIILFLIFLPLKSVEIPSIVAGFSINLGRLFIVLSIFALLVNLCRNRGSLQIFFEPLKNSNPFLTLLILYILFSTLQYYAMLAFHETLLFGSQDFFFRSWKGRPLGQLISFLTYGVIPYFILKYFAEDNEKREIIEKAIIITTLFLVYYGIFQQISYYLGWPVTGLDTYNGIVAVYPFDNFTMLRFYSLGGEPRDFGGYILGAMFFYFYCNCGKRSLFFSINMILMITAFFLTISTSAYICLVLSAIVMFLDSILLKRKKLIKTFFIVSLMLILILTAIQNFTDVINILTERTLRYAEAFFESLRTTGSVHFWVTGQSPDLSIVYYFVNVDKTDLYQLFFGSGYGNFLTPAADILKEYFNYDPAGDPIFADTRSFGVKILIELGLFGTILYLVALYYPLKLNKVLIRFYSHTDRVEYYKMILLRYSYIIFCVSNMIHISFFYFIVMAIIVGRYNSFVKSKENEFVFKYTEGQFTIQSHAI